ncbi:MAG: hypothetical protein MUO26_13700 [Methanotrichaceae archaeon]|nr:hypothetical protein [Methanotrichaceae archaeon]
MTKSGNFLVFLFLLVAMTNLASIAFAQCPSCGGVEDWTASATSFLEGKPINDTQPSLNPPQLARLSNTEFNSSLLQKNTIQASNGKSNLAATPAPNISLKNIYALPNPVNSGSPILLNVIFGNNSLNTLINTTANNLSVGTMTVYAIIRNSAGTDVSKVNLEPISGEGYAGIWNANVTAGIYNATVAASAFGTSKTFDDALQIEVSKTA